MITYIFWKKQKKIQLNLLFSRFCKNMQQMDVSEDLWQLVRSWAEQNESIASDWICELRNLKIHTVNQLQILAKYDSPWEEFSGKLSVTLRSQLWNWSEQNANSKERISIFIDDES
jgi:hypothetical protein